MKRFFGLPAVIALLLTGSVSTLPAQSNVVGLITVDEFGNGNYFGPPPGNFPGNSALVPIFTNFILPSILGPDPTGGVLDWNVLIYQLPFSGVTGDVMLHEPGGPNPVSDIIRFDGNGHLIFYSDSFDGFHEPADVPELPFPLANQVNINEVGPEGSNSADYSPLSGQPGFAISNTGVVMSYHFISDAPEPATGVLLLGGMMCYRAFGSRFRKS